jgi:C1A family cysteine protease
MFWRAHAFISARFLVFVGLLGTAGMARSTLLEFGWRPDSPDHRDYSLEHTTVVALLGKLKMRARKAADLPRRVDWRDYCGPVEDQQRLATSPAHACVALVQQFERRSSGRLIRLSRLFAHRAALRLSGSSAGSSLSLRSVLKAIVRCGAPPEELWPYDHLHMGHEPDPFAFSFHRDFDDVCFVRLDARKLAPTQVLAVARSFLAAGFPLAFGFPVCGTINREPEIPFPTSADRIVGGQAVTAVGYDDRLRIRSDRGALLVRNSWGPDWGEDGYGWLPYAYVTERLAIDFWTLLKPSWLKSGEFELPALSRTC